MTFSALGNRFLLRKPFYIQIQCSRSLTEQQIEAEKAKALALYRQGAILVSPSISPGERAIMRAAFDAGFPDILFKICAYVMKPNDYLMSPVSVLKFR